MNPYWLLPLIAVCCLTGATLSYTDARGWRWYPLVGAVLGACTGLLWAMAARWCGTRERVFVFSVWYDAVAVLAYYLLPVAWFALVGGDRPGVGVIVGGGLVVAGLVVVHVCGG